MHKCVTKLPFLRNSQFNWSMFFLILYQSGFLFTLKLCRQIWKWPANFGLEIDNLICCFVRQNANCQNTHIGRFFFCSFPVVGSSGGRFLNRSTVQTQTYLERCISTLQNNFRSALTNNRPETFCKNFNSSSGTFWITASRTKAANIYFSSFYAFETSGNLIWQNRIGKKCSLVPCGYLRCSHE